MLLLDLLLGLVLQHRDRAYAVLEVRLHMVAEYVIAVLLNDTDVPSEAGALLTSPGLDEGRRDSLRALGWARAGGAGKGRGLRRPA